VAVCRAHTLRLRKLARELGERLEKVFLFVDGALRPEPTLLSVFRFQHEVSARGAFRRHAGWGGRRGHEGATRESGERGCVGHHVHIVHREVFRLIELLCDDKKTWTLSASTKSIYLAVRLF
jgi:hypothetical protein